MPTVTKDIRIDLTGNRYGKLTVLEFLYKRENKHLMWKCVCDCGGEAIVQGNNLKTGHTSSCGCIRLNRHTKHGHTKDYKKSPEYRIWGSMKSRCYNPNNKEYHNYGGRGIKVCERWLDKEKGFLNFISDMGSRPKGKWLDRVENDGDYIYNNCDWTTPQAQQNNRRNNHVITFRGESLTISQWSKRLNINPKTLANRLTQYSWSEERALTTPVRGI